MPLAIEEMRSYLDAVKSQRRMLLQEPLRRAALRIRRGRTDSAQLAAELAPPRRTSVERGIERHGRQAERLMEELSARKEPMLRVLAVIVPEEQDR